LFVVAPLPFRTLDFVKLDHPVHTLSRYCFPSSRISRLWNLQPSSFSRSSTATPSQPRTSRMSSVGAFLNVYVAVIVGPSSTPISVLGPPPANTWAVRWSSRTNFLWDDGESHFIVKGHLGLYLACPIQSSEIEGREILVTWIGFPTAPNGEHIEWFPIWVNDFSKSASFLGVDFC
jgi:hypothetical protein